MYTKGSLLFQNSSLSRIENLQLRGMGDMDTSQIWCAWIHIWNAYMHIHTCTRMHTHTHQNTAIPFIKDRRLHCLEKPVRVAQERRGEDLASCRFVIQAICVSEELGSLLGILLSCDCTRGSQSCEAPELKHPREREREREQGVLLSSLRTLPYSGPSRCRPVLTQRMCGARGCAPVHPKRGWAEPEEEEAPQQSYQFVPVRPSSQPTGFSMRWGWAQITLGNLGEYWGALGKIRGY